MSIQKFDEDNLLAVTILSYYETRGLKLGGLYVGVYWYPKCRKLHPTRSLYFSS